MIIGSRWCVWWARVSSPAAWCPRVWQQLLRLQHWCYPQSRNNWWRIWSRRERERIRNNSLSSSDSSSSLYFFRLTNRIRMTESVFSVHSFQHNLCENIVNYQVTTLQGQTMIWIGSGEPCLGNLSAAVPCRDYPSTALLGQSDQSNMLASRLSKKLNKQVRDNCATETVFRTTYF